jgi:hypothetical protein
MSAKTVRINIRPSMPPIKEEVLSDSIVKDNYFSKTIPLKREKEVVKFPKVSVVGKGGKTKKRSNKKRRKSLRR